MIDNLHIRLDQRAIQLRRRKLLWSIFTLLIILSLLSLIFGFIQYRINSNKNHIAEITRQVNWAVEQARDLVPVSPSRALQILTEQEEAVFGYLNASSAKSVHASLNQLLDLIKFTREDTGLVHTLDDPQVLLDLNLIRSDTSASQIIYASGRLLVLDKNNRRLLSVPTDSHSGEVIAAGDSLSDVISFTANANNLYFLHPHQISSTSFTRLGFAEQNLGGPTQIISDPDNVWQNPVSLAVFAGNIYILDKGNSEIYKYSGTIDSESRLTRRRWLAAGVTPDLSDAMSLFVDGDLWILHASGSISRFRQGRLINSLQLPEDLFTSPARLNGLTFGGSNLYLLSNDSITVLDPASGGFISQWKFSNIQPVDFVVSESENKIFLLGQDKIYSVDLSNQSN